MPGKYLEYIRTGDYAVPVEITFLPSIELDCLTGLDYKTSKWVLYRHWKEVKTMIKPAVELAAKYTLAAPGKETMSKSHHISIGGDITLGYIIHPNIDNSPFLSVLEPKHSWTEDEDDVDTDENSNLSDYGGRYKDHNPTKYYVKACVVKKTLSFEDARKIRKELGIPAEDVRNYFPPTKPTLLCPPSPASSTDMSLSSLDILATTNKSSRKKKKSTSKKSGDRGLRGSSIESNASSEELVDIPWSSGTVYTSTKYNDQSQSSTTTGANARLSSEGRQKNLNGDTENDTSRRPGANILESLGLSKNWRGTDGKENKDESEVESLPDIDYPYIPPMIYPQRGKRGRKPGRKPRKKSVSDRSPETGLPDIGGITKGGRKRKKQNIAVVQPLKQMRNHSHGHIEFDLDDPMSIFAALPTEGRRKGRNQSSPSFDRRHRTTKNYAINILDENSDLLTIAGENRTVIVGGNIKPPRKPRKRKRVEKPAAIPVDADHTDPETEDIDMEFETESESDIEMPEIDKMVSTSEEEQTGKEVESEANSGQYPSLELGNTGNSVDEVRLQDESTPTAGLEQVGTKQPTVTTNTRIVDPNAQISNNNEKESKTNKSVQKKKKIFKKRSKSKVQKEKSNVENHDAGTNSRKNLKQSTGSLNPVRRARFASDSDDITSESAYRKTPIIRKKRKKRLVEKTKDATSNEQECNPVNEANTEISLRTSSTEDAQTQTIRPERVVENAPYTEPAIATVAVEPLVEEQIEPVEPTAITKSEHTLGDHSYDSDYVNEGFSDGDDDDVVFEGEFKVNLHLPALGSPEEGSDDELFSFDNPVQTSANQSSALNDESIAPVSPTISVVHHVEQVPYIEAVEGEEPMEYSFDVAVQPTRGTGKPQTDSEVIRAFRPDFNVNSDSEEHEIVESNLESMSTYHLISRPGTMKAGIRLFNNLAQQKIGPDEFGKRVGFTEDTPSDEIEIERDLMPPPLIPLSRRPPSPDICSLNPEETLRRPKLRRQKHTYVPAESVRISPQRFHSPSQPHEGLVNDDDGADEEPMLRELMSRFSAGTDNLGSTQYQPYGDEFDLSQRSHIFLDVFPDYAEKSRLYKIHSRNIKDLTQEQLHEQFAILKPELQGIFDGSIATERSELYRSKNQQKMQTLRGLNLTSHRTFNTEQARILSNLLFNDVLPQQGSRLEYADFVNYVMLPEFYILIYSNINKITRSMAENELRYGACYGGSLSD